MTIAALIGRGVIGALIACAPLPAMAQDDVGDPEGSEEIDSAQIDAMLGMLTGMFGSDPLTPQQEARIPAATAVVSTMMPDGFYTEIMREMLDTTLRPMFEMLTGPRFVIAERTGAEMDLVEGLSEQEQSEIALLLDPAYAMRSDAMLDGMMGMMNGMFGAVEGPMRDGLSKAYAKKFTADQLADIAAFFATPTGRLYATESMKLFADPEVLGATMQAMPAMMGSLGDMTQTMEALEDSLPAKATFADLSAADRARIANALGITVAGLKTRMEAAEEAAAAQPEAAAEMAATMDAMEQAAQDAD